MGQRRTACIVIGAIYPSGVLPLLAYFMFVQNNNLPLQSDLAI